MLRHFQLLLAWVTRREKWLVGAIVLYSTARNVWYARREFGTDEIFTFYISKLDRLDQIFQAGPPDGNPPLYYVLAHLSQSVLGPTELATRLPAILAFAVSLIGTYVFVRRRCPAISALFALVALDSSLMWYEAAEARPYALLLAFTIVALIGWQAAAKGKSNRRLPLAVMALGIAGATASHHYGVFHVGVPLAVGETARLIERRRLDVPLYGAGIAGAAMLIVTLPLMWQTNLALLQHVRGLAVFFGKPRLADLDSYRAMVDPWLVGPFLLMLALTWRFVPPVPPEAARRAIPVHEIAAAAGLAALVPIVMATAWLVTGYFQPRYAIGTSIGIAILLGFAASDGGRLLRGGSAAALLSMLLLGLLLLGDDLRTSIAVWRGRVPPVDLSPRHSVLEAVPIGKPIVIASPLTYVTLWWYSAPELRDRLHYLSDLSFAVRQRDPLAELSLVGDQRFVPSKVEPYQAFISAHSEFLLYCEISREGACVDEATWIRDRLLSEGHKLTIVSQTARDILFSATRP